MKTVTVRMPDELHEWLRERAAKETIKRKQQYSINTLVVDLIREEMEADRKKGA